MTSLIAIARYYLNSCGERAQLVPKAAMDKDCSFPARKGEIRLPRKFGHMETIPEPQPVDEATNLQFGLSVLPTDAAHTFASFEWR